MLLKVFIIEDEAVVARDLCQNITRLGHEVVGAAHTGAQALEMIPATSPDVVLADVRLKGALDGIEVIRQLRLKIQVPVIFVTAYSDRETLKRAQTVDPQGYILKPVNPRELDIAIEMAVHEFQLQRELVESRQLLNTALSCIGNAVVYIDIAGSILNINSEALDLLGIDRVSSSNKHWSEVLVGGSPNCRDRLSRLVDNVIQTRSVSRISPLQLRGSRDLEVVDGIIGPIYEEDDSNIVTGVILMLRKLAELEYSDSELVADDLLTSASESTDESPMSDVLMLINPDDFENVNNTLGKRAGDIVLNETIREINQQLRLTDLATRYGGAVFSATLPRTSLADARDIAERLHERLTSYRYLGGKVQLSFSIGLAQLEPGDAFELRSLPIELFRRATWALNASHEAGGSRITVWDPNRSHHMLSNLDRESGKFSTTPDDDYRGLTLLWNTVQTVSNSSRLDQLANEVVVHLRNALGLSAAAFLVRADEEPLELVAAVDHASSAHADLERLEFSSDALQAVLEMIATGQPQLFSLGETDNAGTRYGLPLVYNGSGIGILLLGRDDGDSFSVQQIRFLETIAEYLGVAVDHALLAGREQSRVAMEAAEFEKTISDSELIYESQAMDALMSDLRMVAPTDATVMICGESGTGKDLLARTIHKFSPRSDQPFMVVDCSTIVPSLMESELFGHRKGAFTGANERNLGKIKEADGGTLFLDEVGELPLDLQMKLLRFTQERTFSPVGDSRVESVDVRLLMATNRDLAAEVERGNFRGDLFFRLNVFKLEAPPLRDRGRDVLLIAKHFLSALGSQYGRDILGFTPEVERQLLHHHWAGNVRELRNLILRAVIRCQSPYLDVSHLAITTDGIALQQRTETPNNAALRFSGKVAKTALEPLSDGASLRRLDESLRQLASYNVNLRPRPELGLWLERRCLLMAQSFSADVSCDAARMLGMPDSTYRRKLQALNEATQGIEPQHTGGFERALEQVLRQPPRDLGNLLVHLRGVLSAALEHSGISQRVGACLMGVSEPTYRKWSRKRV